mmetsp:Transcript_53642/g.100550  ORF Transcript_53642/g.100550 Transcript_53642/m.100550 type:complete len:157 (+) Transcript_53642:56-526(+)
MGPSRLLLALLISVPSKALRGSGELLLESTEADAATQWEGHVETVDALPADVERPEGEPYKVASDGWSPSDEEWFLKIFKESYGGCAHHNRRDTVSSTQWITCLAKKIMRGMPSHRTGVILSQNTGGWLLHALPCAESLTAQWGQVMMITCSQSKK